MINGCSVIRSRCRFSVCFHCWLCFCFSHAPVPPINQQGRSLSQSSEAMMKRGSPVFPLRGFPLFLFVCSGIQDLEWCFLIDIEIVFSPAALGLQWVNGKAAASQKAIKKRSQIACLSAVITAPLLAAPEKSRPENCIPRICICAKQNKIIKENKKRGTSTFPQRTENGVQLSAILSRISIPNKTLDALTAHEVAAAAAASMGQGLRGPPWAKGELRGHCKRSQEQSRQVEIVQSDAIAAADVDVRQQKCNKRR